MFGLLIALLVIVSKMPDNNPLKRILGALSYRVVATVAAGMIAIPIEPIPGLDTLYDFAVPIALIWYWFTFFGSASLSVLNRRMERQHSGSEQFWACTTVHSALEGLQSIDLPLGLAVAPAFRQRVCDCVEISSHRPDEALHCVNS
jgi:hypothetical protein